MLNLKTEGFSRKQLILGTLICTLGALFYCYEFILRIIPGILQDEISNALGQLSASVFGQIAALYYLAYSPMQLPVGMLMDRFGPRYSLTLACFCCAIGSYMFSSTSIPIVSFGRLLVGFGSAFAFVGFLSATVNWLPKRYFSLFAGLLTSLSMLGLISGEIYITRLVKDLPLNQVLMSAAMVGLILALAIFFVVRDSPSTQKQQGRLIPFPVFLKQVFLVLRSPYTWIIGLMGACLYTSLSIFGELWGKSFLEISFHLSKEQAAQSMAYMFLGWAVGAPLSGFCSDRSRQRLHPIIVCTMGALICFCLILYASQLSYTGLNLCLFGYGLFSSIEITVFIMANEYSKVPHLSGTTFSAVNMIVSFMGMIFQPLVGALLDWSSPYGYVHHYSLGNYRVGLSVVVVALLTVLVISISLLFHPSRAKNSN